MHGGGNRLGVARMTAQTTGRNVALEPRMFARVVSRRHVPALLGRIPGDRRFVKETVDFDQVGTRVVARADAIADRRLHARHGSPIDIAYDFFVEQQVIAAIDPIDASGSLVFEFAIGRLASRVDVRHGLTVCGKQIRLVPGGVTLSAGGHTDIVRVRSGVQERRWRNRRLARRIAALVQPLQRRAQTGIIGREFASVFEMYFGVLEVSAVEQHVTQGELESEVGGQLGDADAQGLDRRLRLAEVLQRQTPEQVSLGVIGPQFGGAGRGRAPRRTIP